MAVKEIYILPGGLFTVDRSVFLTAVDIGQKIRAPVYSVVLIHDEGPILIDVGLNPDGLTDPEQAWGPRAKVAVSSAVGAAASMGGMVRVSIGRSKSPIILLLYLVSRTSRQLLFVVNKLTICPSIMRIIK